MISEFQDLSDKIDRLAELTASLRRENASLRQANAVLTAENAGFTGLLAEAQRRVAALLEKIPAPGAAEPTVTDDEAAQ
jgi:cell division protein ZapB